MDGEERVHSTCLTNGNLPPRVEWGCSLRLRNASVLLGRLFSFSETPRRTCGSINRSECRESIPDFDLFESYRVNTGIGLHTFTGKNCTLDGVRAVRTLASPWPEAG